MRRWQSGGDPKDPSAWTDCLHFYPTSTGSYRTGPSWEKYQDADVETASPGTTLNAWCGLLPSGSATCVVGTSTKLYVQNTYLSTGVFNDKSKGGGYTATNWHFCQFGNITIACDLANSTQFRNATTTNAFADLSGAPKAKICISQNNAVILFNYNDGVNAYTDGWWASDVGDYTTWTPSSSNDAANGRIISRPGPITAAVQFRDEIIVFKESSIYRMRYVGQPIVYTVDMISDGIGARSKSGVVSCGDFILFSSENGTYLYDGSSLKNIGTGFDYQGQNNIGIQVGSFEPCAQSGLWFPASGHVVLWGAFWGVVYNVNSGAWGKIGLIATATPVQGYKPLIGSSADIQATSGSVPGLGGGAYKALYGVNLSNSPNVVCDIPGPGYYASSSYLTSSIIGDESVVTNCSRVTPKLTNSSQRSYTIPTASALTCAITSYQNGEKTGGASVVTAASSSNGTRRFDVNFSCRLFTVKIACTEEIEIEDIAVVMKQAGTD